MLTIEGMEKADRARVSQDRQLNVPSGGHEGCLSNHAVIGIAILLLKEKDPVRSLACRLEPSVHSAAPLITTSLPSNLSTIKTLVGKVRGGAEMMTSCVWNEKIIGCALAHTSRETTEELASRKDGGVITNKNDSYVGFSNAKFGKSIDDTATPNYAAKLQPVYDILAWRSRSLCNTSLQFEM